MSDDSLTVYLYVIGPECGPVKVGRSMCPPKRLKQLEGITGYRLFLTGQWPIGQSIALCAEMFAHHLLREKHVGAEWFDVSAEEAAAAVERAITVDHVPGFFMPALDTKSAELRDGVYARTKFPRDLYQRMNVATEGHHAAFIREAIAEKLERENKP